MSNHNPKSDRRTRTTKGPGLLLAMLFVLFCHQALGLGAGKLTLKSHLTQPLDAEIALIDLGNISPGDIMPRLARPADIDRLGVTHSTQPGGLVFRVGTSENGQDVIHVTSREPIVHPVLDFILEMSWPGGRILREYALLVDPLPAPGQQASEQVGASIVSGGATSGDAAKQDITHVKTNPGDSLWKIAVRVRPTNQVSMHQVIQAIQAANPGAFIGNNANLMQVGQVLRIPGLDEMRAIDADGALAGFQNQRHAFEEYKAGKTLLDARKTTGRNEGRGIAETEDELRLLAADLAGSGADDADAGTLTDVLAAVREDLDSTRRANIELNARLDDLAAQVETLKDIISLKDDQLTALQKALREEKRSDPMALMENPFILGGLVILLLGFIAALLMYRRRSGVDAGKETSLPLQEDDAQAVIASDDAEQDIDDLLGEADVHTAYGRFPEAIGLLQEAVEWEPDDTGIQLKLLEVYAQVDDAQAFDRLFERMKRLGNEEANARGLELRALIPLNRDETGAGDTVADDPDDELDSKLDIARAYIELGKHDAARALLEEVIGTGDEAEAGEARDLLEKIPGA